MSGPWATTFSFLIIPPYNSGKASEEKFWAVLEKLFITLNFLFLLSYMDVPSDHYPSFVTFSIAGQFNWDNVQQVKQKFHGSGKRSKYNNV